MRFTLHYEGPLPTAGSSADKHRIRQHFEPQLRELWTHEPLTEQGETRSRFLSTATDTSDDAAGGLLDPAFATPSALMTRHGFTFAALVCDALGLAAELDILMLRPAAPGQIVVGGGDIDNRLKTLFDALSAPQQAQQLTASMRPTSAVDPFLVLLDDDNRITRVNVETDRLLGAESQDHVRLYVRVQTRIVRTMLANIELGLN